MQKWVWGWGSWYYGNSAGSTEEDFMDDEETDVDSARRSPLSSSPPPPKIGKCNCVIAVVIIISCLLYQLEALYFL